MSEVRRVPAAAGGAEALVLLGGDSPDAAIEWALVDIESGNVSSSGVTRGGDVLPAVAPARTALILPGSDAQLKRLELPARSEAQARAAAAYMFEGAFAAHDDVHYAIGAAQNEAGERLVAAIDAARLSQWLERCRSKGADPHFVALDFTLWPVRIGDVEIIDTPRRTIVAAGLLGGFSIEPALAPSLFKRWFAQTGASGGVYLTGGDPDAWAPQIAGPMHARSAADPVATLARAAIDPPDAAPNLRQGAFAPVVATRRGLGVWKFALVLALLAVLIQIGTLTLAGWRDHRAAQAILVSAERDLRAARPDVTRIVDLRAQTQAMVNAIEQSGAHPVLRLSQPVVRALQTQPLARLDEVTHEGPGRTVRLRFSALQAGTLEAFAGELRNQGLEATAGQQEPREGRVTMQFTIEAQP